ncbi:sugar-binding transcriptional regulator [Leuconostoc gelidum]|uniref:sugar-binding transcriptional regulator n=1 Tax=Leuconostoc gelidum TaxID=1244 RepID=UPI001C7DA761|nr:sugar-binding domain-containing protein [Leuconostoc gelidum]MBZ6010993.1 helix-turn-helix domain-containing protein [Leuconostoc gelidum subsp. aenigmaticum]
MLRIARLYYIEGLEQNQIAKKEGISRPTVSRLLATAREKGFVSIRVNDDLRDTQVLAEQLKTIYSYVEFNVISTAQDDSKIKIKKVAAATAVYLHKLIKNGDIIGIGTGKSIYEVAKQLNIKNVKDVEILPLAGIFSSQNYQSFYAEIVTFFSKAYNTAAQPLPLPIVFDELKTKLVVENEKHIRYLEKLARVANIAIFTVNDLKNSSLLHNSTYISEKEKQNIETQAIGEVLAHFININGTAVNQDLDNRTVSLSLENIRYKEHSVVVIDNVGQVPILYTLLKFKLVNQVFVDQQTAQALLEFEDKED